MEDCTATSSETGGSGGFIYAVGRAVQIDPIKHKLTPPGNKRLKRNCFQCFQIMLAPLHVGTSLATSTDPVVSVHLKNVTLDFSEGLSGGALQLDGGARAILQGCNLFFNKVAFGGRGGAIKVAAESNLIAIDTVFEGNIAEGGLGGAIQAVSDPDRMPLPLVRTSTGAAIDLLNCTFRNNFAAGAYTRPLLSSI